MSIIAWVGLGGAVIVLALVIVIQTLRLKAAGRDLLAAKAVLEDSRHAHSLAENRRATERRVAAKYKQDYAALHDELHRELAGLEMERAALDTARDEVSDAAGNDDATLDVLRRVLKRPSAPVPEREPLDSDPGSDEPL